MGSTEKNSDTNHSKPHDGLPLLCLTALGVIYGDIGTSPLYAIRECFDGPHAIHLSELNILGVLSLILWSLIIIISIKYIGFILRADNRGEGGILALTALLLPRRSPLTKGGRYVAALGLFGAALLYADGMITPAISVLSAVEGLKIATPLFQPFVEPVAVVILIALFFMQSRGTGGVGIIFGPIVLVWFSTLAVLGLIHIVQEPDVLSAVNPLYGAEFLLTNGVQGFVVLGTVFLVVTGGEALYADIGHFGTKPVRLTWFAVVLPALLINYFGQGAFLMHSPEGAVNPLYRMAPTWAIYPLVVLATAAAIIASQAVISGAFSLTLQAVQLGYCPRVEIRHTSKKQMGQIYIPSVNYLLMIASIALVVGFHSSSNLAAAYGVAITVTMVITTLLFFVLVTGRWQWGFARAALLCGVFLIIDLLFFGANITKIWDGGWFPLVIGLSVFTVMSTWRAGRKVLRDRMRERIITFDEFWKEIERNPPKEVSGVAVFMCGSLEGVPHALHHNITYNKVRHETVLLVNVATEDVPHVSWNERTEVTDLGQGFYQIILNYGFMDEPDVPRDLLRLHYPGLSFSKEEMIFFVGRETLLATDRPGLAKWRERLFAILSRNARSATSFFNIPPEQVMEIGVQIEL